MSQIKWNVSNVSVALEVIDKSRKPLLSEIKKLANEFNSWDEDLKYYDILAGDWLEYYMHIIYSIMLDNLDQDGAVHAQSPPSILAVADIDKFNDLRFEVEYKENLNDQVVALHSGIDPKSWTYSSPSVVISSGRKKFRQKIISSISTKNPVLLLVRPYWKTTKINVLKLLLSWRKWALWDDLDYPLKFEVAIDIESRLRFASRLSSNELDFIAISKALLPLNLPVALLEGLADYRTAVQAMPVHRPQAVYTRIGLHAHLTFKLLFADWAKRGTKLLCGQHGGGYGSDKIHALEQFESRIADRFYTWGWKKENNKKVQPLVIEPFPSFTFKKKIILLNCVDYPDHVFRIQFQPMPGSTEKMRLETCKFLLNFTSGENIVIRPYFKDYSGDFVDMMQKSAPRALLDDHSVSSFVRFSQSKLVVHNYLGTSFLETLALNTPTICFYDPTIYAFRPEAEDFYDALERVGILHRSAESAANFVMSIEKNVLGWWSEKEIQDVRRNFVDNFVRFSENWIKEWEHEFRKVIDENDVISQ